MSRRSGGTASRSTHVRQRVPAVAVESTDCLTATAANESAESVIDPATKPSTTRTPIDWINGPAATAPKGPASVATVITAAITLGRRASGVRTVSTPSSGALIRGVRTEDGERKHERSDRNVDREQPERKRPGHERDAGEKIMLPVQEMLGALHRSLPFMNSEPRLLIAEDEDRLRRLLEMLLGSRGYRLTLAKDGAEALELFNGGCAVPIWRLPTFACRGWMG